MFQVRREREGERERRKYTQTHSTQKYTQKGIRSERKERKTYNCS